MLRKINGRKITSQENLDNIMRKPHTDKEFERALQELRERLLRMAGRVEDLVSRSVDAFVAHDGHAASKAIALDQEINQDEVDIDAHCFHIITRWQPMTSDLRLLILAVKMVTDLERIGDLAVNLCERTVELAEHPPLAPYRDIPEMARIVMEMVRTALDAVVQWNTGKAERVFALDEQVDQLYGRVFRHILELMQERPEAIEQGIQLQAVAKYLERMGDHATNLAEQAIYLIEGKDVRHEGKRRYSAA